MSSINSGVQPRNAIDKAYTWNAESVFPSLEAWSEGLTQALEQARQIQAFRGRLTEGASVLADYMEAADRLNRLAGKVFVYASMETNCDSTDAAATGRFGQARNLFGQVRGAIAFAQPELLAIGHDTLTMWLASEARLTYYAHYLHNLFRLQAHVRSGEVEELLGLLSDPFGSPNSVYGMLTSADMTFSPAIASDGSAHPISQGNVWTLIGSKDRALRQSAWESYQNAYLALKNTLAANLSASIKQDVFRARARGYQTCLESSLFENNIPSEVFYNLIDTFKQNIPTWHKYWNIRRRVLGVDTLHPWDIWAPLTPRDPQVPYTQAVEWITAGMRPLGDAYADAMQKGCLEDRWVDVYPNIGKRAGAFSSGVHDTMPFIMMSYDNDLGAMSTLAHELGHSMHSYLARKTQPAVYSGYSLFVAEVASNFNQAMTRAYLREAKKDDVDFQIALIHEAMGNFHRYFFIMPTLARFELEVHTRAEQGKGLTAQDMNTLMADLFEEGYGSELHAPRDQSGITWAQFSHLYAQYYVYQYATGISAAHALAGPILAGDGDAARRYIEFLSMGSAKYPLDALKHAGVDMTRPDAVETTFAVLAEMVDRLEQLTGV
ncbi:MAG: oligoendopeptidase F [Anaerolineae bacterium]|jgi:oligoendopeptidase F|nr:oligoendopeptidase F [Anaerolineae bacterium]